MCDTQSCAICLEILTEKDKTILSCEHTFHASCLFENIVKSNNTCPLCRVEISKKTESRPDLNQSIYTEFITELMNERFDILSSSVTDDVYLNQLQDIQKGGIKLKIGYILSVFGVELSKKIKTWIEQGESRIIYIPEQDANIIPLNDLEHFINENGLSQFRERLLNNIYLSNYDNLINAGVQTFMYPPGHENINNAPYFNRNEAEYIMGGVVNHFASTFNEYMTL
jgi:hypothetical protein